MKFNLKRIALPLVFAAIGHAGSIDVTTGGSWTITIASQSISNAAPFAGYTGGNFISAFSGSACLSTACTSTFDGFYTAAFTFTVPADTSTVSLTFSGLQADDRTVLELNGVQIGNAYDTGSAGAAPVTGSMVLSDGGPNNSFHFGGAGSASGTVASGFNVGGTNTLLLIVNNTEEGAFGSLNPHGFTEVALSGTVAFTESGSVTTPEPQSAWMVFGGAALIAATQWRRKRATARRCRPSSGY